MSPSKPSYVVVYSLWAEDLGATAHFYRDVIGLDLLPHHGDHPAFSLGSGAHLVLVEGKPRTYPAAKSRPFPAIAFAVEDLDLAVDYLRAHGVELPWGIETGPQARWVMFWDPAGNLVELAQLQEPRPTGQH